MKKIIELHKNLSGVQRDFWNALTDRETKPSKDLSFLSSTTERLDIYRHAYRARISDSIKEDFSYFVEEIGPIRFQTYLDGFFEKGGSTQFSLIDTSLDFFNFAKDSQSLSEKQNFFLQLDFNSIALFYTDTKKALIPNGSTEELIAKKWTLSDSCLLMELRSDLKFYVLHKDANGFVESKALSEIEYAFLKHFSQNVLTLEQCAELVLNNDEWKSSVDQWINQVASWFETWSREQILTLA